MPVYTWNEKHHVKLEDDTVETDMIQDNAITLDKLDLYGRVHNYSIRLNADQLSTDIWDKSVFYANSAYQIIGVGVMFDAEFSNSIFNNFTLDLYNRGVNGTDSILLVSETFNGLHGPHDYNSIGLILIPIYIYGGEVLSLEKTITGTGGEPFPGGLLHFIMQRSE